MSRIHPLHTQLGVWHCGGRLTRSKEPPGEIISPGQEVKPREPYEHQLSDRLGRSARRDKRRGPKLRIPLGALATFVWRLTATMWLLC